MIIKGQPAIITYTSRSRIDNSYVNSPQANHTITVYGYKYESGSITSMEITPSWTQASSQIGFHLIRIVNTNFDCIVITGTSSDDTYIGPIVIYPVDLGAIADAVLDSSAASHQTTGSIGEFINNGPGSQGGTATVDTTDLETQVGYLTTQVTNLGAVYTNLNSVYGNLNTGVNSVSGKIDNLPSAILDTTSTGHTNSNTIGGSVYAAANNTGSSSSGSSGTSSGGTIDTTALNNSITTLNQAITNLGTISSNFNSIHSTLSTDTSNILSSINGIPGSVWTYPITVDNYTKDPFEYISDEVWGRSGSDRTSRKLTSNKLANSEDELALGADVNVVLNSNDIQLTIPDEEDIAKAVWNYGKNSGVSNITGRSLSTQSVIPSNGVVNDTLAVTSDLSNLTVINNLTELLTKVYGVLCHWKEEGDNIVVYNDSNENILTIPTVKNKYGDIVKMGAIPEDA